MEILVFSVLFHSFNMLLVTHSLIFMTHKWAMTRTLEIVFQRWLVVECELTGNFGGFSQPFHSRSMLPSSQCWVQGRLSMPGASPREGSQCHGAWQEVKAEPLCWLSGHLNSFAFDNFRPSLDWLLQLTTLPEREGLNKDNNSI